MIFIKQASARNLWILWNIIGCFSVILIVLYLYYERILIVNEDNFNTENLDNKNGSIYLTQNSSKCLLPFSFCKESLTLLIIIFTQPQNFGKREAIRKTWSRYKNRNGEKNFKAYFLMGQTQHLEIQKEIKLEFMKYKDLIQEDFIDTKFNKSIKSLMMLKLIKRFCTDRVEYLAKTDDNVYVNILQLLKNLPEGGRDILMGNLKKKKKKKNSVWKKSHTKVLHKDKIFLSYLAAPSYIMSINVVTKLYKAAFNHKVFFIEHIYITGILPKLIGLRPIDHEMFTHVEKILDYCILNTPINFINNLNELEMIKVHKWMKSGIYKTCKGSLYISKGKYYFVPMDEEATLSFFEPSVSLEKLN